MSGPLGAALTGGLREPGVDDWAGPAAYGPERATENDKGGERPRDHCRRPAASPRSPNLSTNATSTPEPIQTFHTSPIFV